MRLKDGPELRVNLPDRRADEYELPYYTIKRPGPPSDLMP